MTEEPELWTPERQLAESKKDYEKLVQQTVQGAAMQIFWAANGLLDHAKDLGLPRNYAYGAIIKAIEKPDGAWGDNGSLAMLAFSGQGFEGFKKDAEGRGDWGLFGPTSKVIADKLFDEKAKENLVESIPPLNSGYQIAPAPPQSSKLEPTAPREDCVYCGRPLYNLPSRECICEQGRLLK